MLEGEAVTKWCPMVRSDNVSESLHGRKVVTEDIGPPLGKIQTGATYSVRCIASRCMMWREQDRGGRCGLAGPA